VVVKIHASKLRGVALKRCRRELHNCSYCTSIMPQHACAGHLEVPHNGMSRLLPSNVAIDTLFALGRTAYALGRPSAAIQSGTTRWHRVATIVRRSQKDSIGCIRTFRASLEGATQIEELLRSGGRVTTAAYRLLHPTCRVPTCRRCCPRRRAGCQMGSSCSSASLQFLAPGGGRCRPGTRPAAPAGSAAGCTGCLPRLTHPVTQSKLCNWRATGS
jgi:hypothetical protein